MSPVVPTGCPFSERRANFELLVQLFVGSVCSLNRFRKIWPIYFWNIQDVLFDRCVSSFTYFDCLGFPSSRVVRRGSMSSGNFRVSILVQLVIYIYETYVKVSHVLHNYLCKTFCAVVWISGENNYNINPLKTKRCLFYIRTQSVPRCKHSTPRL
jgi:hypothetical protein